MYLKAEQDAMKDRQKRPHQGPRKKRKPVGPSNRKRLAFTLRAQGLSYAEMGDRLNISRQRAQQLVRPPRELYSNIMERAGYACEECRIDLRNGEGHIHHIKGDDFDFNNEANLLYLCRSCHRAAHL